MIYFDSDMSRSTNTVVYFDWKTVIYIYAALAVSFIGGGNQTTRRKPPTSRQSLTNFITYSNMASFCRFVNKRASYPFGISLAQNSTEKGQQKANSKI
jgi:hypothetical protein